MVEKLLHTALTQAAEKALGLTEGRTRFGSRGKLSGYPRLTPDEETRARRWFKGLDSESGTHSLFVYNHWVRNETKDLFKSPWVTIRRRSGVWTATIKGLTATGSSAREAAEKLSREIANATALAVLYDSVKNSLKSSP